MAAARRATSIQAGWRGFLGRRRSQLLAFVQIQEDEAIEGLTNESTAGSNRLLRKAVIVARIDAFQVTRVVDQNCFQRHTYIIVATLRMSARKTLLDFRKYNSCKIGTLFRMSRKNFEGSFPKERSAPSIRSSRVIICLTQRAIGDVPITRVSETFTCLTGDCYMTRIVNNLCLLHACSQFVCCRFRANGRLLEFCRQGLTSQGWNGHLSSLPDGFRRRISDNGLFGGVFEDACHSTACSRSITAVKGDELRDVDHTGFSKANSRHFAEPFPHKTAVTSDVIDDSRTCTAVSSKQDQIPCDGTNSSVEEQEASRGSIIGGRYYTTSTTDTAGRQVEGFDSALDGIGHEHEDWQQDQDRGAAGNVVAGNSAWNMTTSLARHSPEAKLGVRGDGKDKYVSTSAYTNDRRHDIDGIHSGLSETARQTGKCRASRAQEHLFFGYGHCLLAGSALVLSETDSFLRGWSLSRVRWRKWYYYALRVFREGLRRFPSSTKLLYGASFVMQVP